MSRTAFVLGLAVTLGGCGSSAPQLSTAAGGFAPANAICRHAARPVRAGLRRLLAGHGDVHSLGLAAEALGNALAGVEGRVSAGNVIALDGYRAALFELAAAVNGKDPSGSGTPVAAARQLRTQLDGSDLVKAASACRV